MKRMILMVVVVLVALTAKSQSEFDALNDKFAREMNELFDKSWEPFKPDSVNENGEWQKVVKTNLSAKDGYKYGREVLARMLPNYQRNVKLEDEKSGKIICNAALLLSAMRRSRGDNILLKGLYKMTLTFVFKDGRFRIRAESVTCNYVETYISATLGAEREDFRTTYIKTNKFVQTDLERKAGMFIRDFAKALEKQKSDDNF